MKTQNEIKIQVTKIILIAVVMVATYIHSATAQSLKNFARENNIGFEGSFGIKTFSLTSNIAEINGLTVIEEGGTIGVIAGVNALRLKIRQGYYYSSSAVVQTVDEVRSAMIINLYPLHVFGKSRSRIQPYFTGGLERNILKMYGTYGSETSKPRNYSMSEAPYLGKISSAIASIGAGIEYKVSHPKHFVNFFAEGKYGMQLSTGSASEMFNNTTTSDQVVINIGIGFGYNK
jgi:hypothetical protein